LQNAFIVDMYILTNIVLCVIMVVQVKITEFFAKTLRDHFVKLVLFYKKVQLNSVCLFWLFENHIGCGNVRKQNVCVGV